MHVMRSTLTTVDTANAVVVGMATCILDTDRLDHDPLSNDDNDNIL